MWTACRFSRQLQKCKALLPRDCKATEICQHQHQQLETRFCSSTSLTPTVPPSPTTKERLAAEEKTINSIWTSACLAGNPNTTAVDFPPGLGRFVIPPVAYQQTPWLERPAAGFNPIFPWIDASIQHEMDESGDRAHGGLDCSTKRTYQPNRSERTAKSDAGTEIGQEVDDVS